MATEWAKMTIAIPKGLKERMMSCTEDVSWSGLACQAFEGKLAEVASKAKAATVDDLVARLKMTASYRSRPGFRKGLEAGRSWALNDATADELRGAWEFFSREHEKPSGWPFEKVMRSTFEAESGIEVGELVDNPDRMEGAACAAHAICIDAVRVHAPGTSYQGEFTRGEALRIFGGRENCEDTNFVRGFVEAAASVWLDVRDRI